MNSTRRSPLALAVLALLYEAPMHPYRMQQLIKQRGKDEVINVRQRASLYQTIERLQRTGLVEVQGTARAEKWPERTVYALTEAGRQTVQSWLRAMLATPAREFPEFPAALAFLPLLTPADALHQLEARAAALQAELRRIEWALQVEAAGLPRLFLLEEEYVHTQIAAELGWVQALVDDLRSGALTWSDEWLGAIKEQLESAKEGET
jgi:DNA-binding PadR family transcriptional regulator